MADEPELECKVVEPVLVLGSVAKLLVPVISGANLPQALVPAQAQFSSAHDTLQLVSQDQNWPAHPIFQQ